MKLRLTSIFFLAAEFLFCRNFNCNQSNCVQQNLRVISLIPCHRYKQYLVDNPNVTKIQWIHRRNGATKVIQLTIAKTIFLKSQHKSLSFVRN